MGAEKSFDRGVTLFFVLIVIASVMATCVNAPLSFDGAFFLFRVLNAHQFASDHGRLINLPLQLPVMIGARSTENLAILRILFCGTYAAIPLIGLGVSWLVCRSRGSLFIWPAMSICLGGLPGQFSFHSEATIVATLLWPALLAVLVNPSLGVLLVVALTSVAALFSHPYAGPMLAFIVAIAIAGAIVRPDSRKKSLTFALGLGALLLARALMKFDSYEGEAFGFRTVVVSFENAVIGWPLVAIGFIAIGALVALLRPGKHPEGYLLTALALAGIALVIWALHPSDWAQCNDYRYWDAPLCMSLMGCAAVQELWLRNSTEMRFDSHAPELYAIFLTGVIFLLVLSIQGLEWNRGSRRIAAELASSDRGCISFRSVPSIQGTALDFWSLGFYAIELQDRTPRTLMLPHNYSCHLFSRSGDAILVQRGAFNYTKHRGEGWFNLDDAQSRAHTHGRSYLPGT